MEAIQKELDAHQQRLLSAFLRKDALTKQMKETDEQIVAEQNLVAALQFSLTKLTETK